MRNKRLLGMAIIAILLTVVVGVVFAESGIVGGVRFSQSTWPSLDTVDAKGNTVKGKEKWFTFFENTNDYHVAVTAKSSGFILKDTEYILLGPKGTGGAAVHTIEGKWTITKVVRN